MEVKKQLTAEGVPDKLAATAVASANCPLSTSFLTSDRVIEAPGSVKSLGIPVQSVSSAPREKEKIQ